ncbi:MAG: hypothetical protein B7X57_03215, partial [Erythrobacter sp. 34-65-8]
LALGRPATVRQSDEPAASRPPPDRTAPSAAGPPDVRPEREIAEMVEQERRNPAEQADDLLDSRRPVE